MHDGPGPAARMTWLVAAGIAMMVVGTFQFAFFPLQRQKRKDLADRGLGRLSQWVPISLGAFVLVRCVPLWVGGLAAIVVGVVVFL